MAKTSKVEKSGGDESRPLSSGEEGTLLVVDDDELNIRSLSRVLSRDRYRVSAARGGREAIELISKNSYDLVILDVIMPELSGLEVLNIVRQEFTMAELPIIMATGLDTTDDILEALRLGANDYLTKPIDSRLALARIKAQLELKRSRDQVHKLNRELKKTQEQVARLMSSSSGAVADIASWAVSVTKDVASSIGVSEIGVWVVEQQQISVLVPSTLTPPTIVDLAWIVKGDRRERIMDTIMPAIGYGGELVAAAVIPGNDRAWPSTAVPVLEALCHQLGGALELREARETPTPRPSDSSDEVVGKRRHVDFVQVCPLCGACYGERHRRCAKCGPAVLLRSMWAIPYHIGDRYRLVESLGTGGMATVFSAKDQRLGREVAVKVIKPEYCGDEVIRARFESEAKAVAQIEDPGVVSVYDCGDVSTGSFYIVMERLYGFELASLVERCGPARPWEMARFLQQTARALSAAHCAKIIHRDLKPSNFFLVPHKDGFMTKILDFGVAKRFGVDENLTRDGILVGTPMYMSPEQASGEHIDERSDLYSLAAVTFHAMTGLHPSQEKNCTRILVDVVRKPPPKLSDHVEFVPPEVDRALLEAMAKDPADRPRSVEQWVNSFVEALEHMPSGYRGWHRPGGLPRVPPVRRLIAETPSHSKKQES